MSKPLDLREFYLVEASSDFGRESVLYQLKSSGLKKIRRVNDGGNLVGFNEPHKFSGLTIEDAKARAEDLTAEYQHNADRCGCHLCYYSVKIEECNHNGG